MRTLIVLLFFPFVVLAQQAPHRLHTALDSNWKFHFGDAADPAKDFNFKTSSIFDGTAQNPQWLGSEPQRLRNLMP